MATAREGDWQCPNTECINHVQFPNSFVFASKVNCTKCGTGKTAKRAGDWCCPNSQCVNHTNTVYGSKPVCQRCGTPKPIVGGKGGQGMQMLVMQPGMAPQAAQMGVQTRQGDWHCPNPTCKNHTGNNYVYGSKQSCGICGTARPAGAGAPTGMAAMPMIPQQYQVASPFQQQLPQFQYQVPQQQQAFVPRANGAAFRGKGHPGDWHCPNPTCKNFTANVVFASKTHCPICNTPKPAGADARPVSKRQEGDWMCPTPGCKNSTNFVYASKPSCSICGAMNPNLDGTRARSRSPRRG